MVQLADEEEVDDGAWFSARAPALSPLIFLRTHAFSRAHTRIFVRHACTWVRSTFATTIRRDRLGDFCSTELAACFCICSCGACSSCSALGAPAPPVFQRERALAHPSTGRPRPCIVLLARLNLSAGARTHFCGAWETADKAGLLRAALPPASQWRLAVGGVGEHGGKCQRGRGMR